ncbi:MAG TPA: nucleotidyltransferase domain-containing protein [Solirubrobacteraceae bacterium]|nr:nucleotidyltransferase domain-containing protein [Solirubrobacteraceae bacterium]
MPASLLAKRAPPGFRVRSRAPLPGKGLQETDELVRAAGGWREAEGRTRGVRRVDAYAWYVLPESAFDQPDRRAGSGVKWQNVEQSPPWRARFGKVREREVDRLVATVAPFAHRRSDIRAVALIGSWARRSARMDSDVDLVLLTADPLAYIEHDGWAAELGADSALRTKRWGALTERRFALPSGLEVDAGLVLPSWAHTDPLDAGAVRVVLDGLVPVYDPDGVLASLLAAVGESEPVS